MQLPADQRRQLDLLKVSLVLATPADAEGGRRGDAARIRACAPPTARASGVPDPAKPDQCHNIDEVTKVLASSRNEKELRREWEGWHTISPPMKKDYARFAELSNKGAKELGFADTGAMWRAKYDMPPDAFAKELDRLWDQVRPLYLELHAYVRMKLHEKYGDVVPEKGPIPAYLLGNIWAQDWSNIYPLVAPAKSDAGYSVTDLLKRHKVEPIDMVKIGERFYTSLGFAPLPKTFWERSLFVRPRDRDVVCHASAWDIDSESDVRIKMCIEQTAEDFSTIHHELGHNFYQRAYKDLPVIFRDSANDGFHEAIGDTIALSVTPEYLVRIGLLDKAPDSSRDIGLLMSRALDKVAFLPFGLLIDQWRWKVFSGEVTPEQYNKAWWDLRLKYQGIAPPSHTRRRVLRSRREVSRARQHAVRALLPRGHSAVPVPSRRSRRPPAARRRLHRCSIYESKEAGQRLNAMLSMGLSKPWPEALDAIDRHQSDGRVRDPRLLRAAKGLARRAGERAPDRLVGTSRKSGTSDMSLEQLL